MSEFEFYKSTTRIYFPEVKQSSPSGRYLFFDGKSVKATMSNGLVIDYGSDSKRLAFLKSSKYLEVISKEEYEANVESNFVVNRGTPGATYNDSVKVAKTIPEDNRFKTIDPQKHFERSTTNLTEQFLSAGLPTASGPNTTNVTEVTEKYQKVDIHASKEVKLPSVGEELQMNSPKDSILKDLPVVPVDIPMKPLNNEKADFEKSWSTFKSFTKKSDRVDYLKSLSYSGVLSFLKEKLEECIEKGDVITGPHNNINLEKQYKEFITLIDKKVSQARAELKI